MKRLISLFSLAAACASLHAASAVSNKMGSSGFVQERGSLGMTVSSTTQALNTAFVNATSGTAIATVADIISTSGVSLTTGTAVDGGTSDFTTTTVTAKDMARCDVTVVDGAATSLTVHIYGIRR
jgi:hypothetical protein